jgi:hypothetical protein
LPVELQPVSRRWNARMLLRRAHEKGSKLRQDLQDGQDSNPDQPVGLALTFGHQITGFPNFSSSDFRLHPLA